MGNKPSGQVRKDSDEEDEYHYHEEILSQSGQKDDSEAIIYRPYKLQTSFTGSDPKIYPAVPGVNNDVDTDESVVLPVEKPAAISSNPSKNPSDDSASATIRSNLTPPAEGDQISPPNISTGSNSGNLPAGSSPVHPANISQDLLEKSSESGSLSVSFSSSKLDSSMSLSSGSSQSLSSSSSMSVTTSSNQTSLSSTSPGTEISSQVQSSARDSPVSEEYNSAQEELQEEEHQGSASKAGAAEAHGKLGVNCFRIDDDESNSVRGKEGDQTRQTRSELQNVFTPLNPAPVSTLPASPSKPETTPGYPGPVILPAVRRSAFMPVRGNSGSGRTGIQSVPPITSSADTPTSPGKRKVDEVLAEQEPGVRRTGGIHRPFSARGTGESNSEAAHLTSGLASPNSKRLKSNQNERPEEEYQAEVRTNPFAGIKLVPTQNALPPQPHDSPGAAPATAGTSGALGKRKLVDSMEGSPSGIQSMEGSPSGIQSMEVEEELSSPRHSPKRLASSENQMTGTACGNFPHGHSRSSPQPSTSGWPGHAARMEAQASTSGLHVEQRSHQASGHVPTPAPHPSGRGHHPGMAAPLNTSSQVYPAGSAYPSQSGGSASAWGNTQYGASSPSEPIPSTSSGRTGSASSSGRHPPPPPAMRPQTPGEEFAHGIMHRGFFRFTLADCLSMTVKTGDITAQSMQALVNPTDSNLTHTGRLSSAIAAAAGLPMMHECQNHLQTRGGPLGPSEAPTLTLPILSRYRHVSAQEMQWYLSLSSYQQVVETCAGGSLDANVTHILHVGEPEWDGGLEDSDSLSQLISTYLGVLTHAEELQVSSVAFPLIGAASFPVDIAIRAVFDAVLIFLSGQLPRSRLRSLCLVITDPSMTDFIISFLTPLLEEVLLKGIDTMVAEALYSYNSSQRLEIQQNELNTALAEELRNGQTNMAAAMEGRLFRGPPVKRPRL